MNKPKAPSHRRRKIWYSVAATGLGTAAVTVCVLWVQAARKTDLANPREGVTALDTELAIRSTPIRFQDVAVERGLVMRHGPGRRHRLLPEDTGSGLAWGDYDGDGDFDLYVVNFPAPEGEAPAPEGYSRLFRNDAGRFVDVTQQAGVANEGGFGMGAAWGDYDADGLVDLYVTHYGRNRLYHNQGDGTFRQVASAAGVDDPLWSTSATWADFDGDGLLDLYVCNYVDYDAADFGPEMTLPRGGTGYRVPFALNPNSFDPVPNRLYRNRGDGTFEDVARAWGVDNPDGRSFAASFCDFNGDGQPDLFVANDSTPDKLFLNRRGKYGWFEAADPLPPGGVGFWDAAPATGTADTRGAMGISVAELNFMLGTPDGLPDLFITHWVAQENGCYVSQRISADLYEYHDKTREFRLGEISLDMVGWGCGFADFDLDGRPDLAVANGSTLEERADPTQLIPEPLFVFWNDGQKFHDVAPLAGPHTRQRFVARGLAIADFDDDGLPDLAVSVNRGPPVLLHNQTRSGHHGLKVRLRGPDAACVGARVEVHAGPVPQVQWLGADVSVMSQHAPELIFGLAARTQADRITVTWRDGRTTTLQHVPAGRVEIHYPDQASPRPGAVSPGGDTKEPHGVSPR